MPAQYDFQNLSFDDFERLSADLMQLRLGVVLESFKVGRDGGIDLRHAPSKDSVTVVQCKRYAPDAFARLKRDLEERELPKIKRLKPKRYVLCTSCKLSPQQKDQLLAVLRPHCQSSGDIYGVDELNRIIAENESIERRHFKLWLGSTAILQRVLNAGIYAYGEHEVESLQREISRYVVHDGFERALQLLDETHHCTIVGIPGVGKTIAARLLLAHYIREGYEVVSVTNDIEDAWRVLDRSPKAKVVVYYDDFLGQVTFSQKLGKNEDRRLLELIAHCKSHSGKRFILTTRDYIFDQALAAHEPLDRAKDSLRRSTVTLDDYSRIVRARLLANHLQFSKVGLDTLRAVLQQRAYDTIITHQNFLPRVIEQLCSDKEVEGRTPEQFIRNAFDVLNDPSRVWMQPFRQLQRDAQYLAYALASLDGDAETDLLETAWRALCAQLGHRIERLYLEVLRETEGSFTHSQAYPTFGNPTKRTGTIVRFINPSAREFVMMDLISNSDRLSSVFSSAVAFCQLLFWNQAHRSLVDRQPHQLAAAWADNVAARAVELLAVPEPEIVVWNDKQHLHWSDAARQIYRLKMLFEALKGMQRVDLVSQVCRTLIQGDLARFPLLMSRDDLIWTSQVLQVVLDVQRTDAPDTLATACESLGIKRWTEFAIDFSGIEHIWDAVGWPIEEAPSSSNWHDLMQQELIHRTRELCGEIPRDWSADEMQDASDELEIIVRKLGNQLAEDLQKLRERVEEVRSAEESGYRSTPSMSSRYRGGRPESESDVDGVFQNLVEHAEANGRN